MSQPVPSEPPVAPDAPAADATDSEEVSGRFKIEAARPEPAGEAVAANVAASDDEAAPAAAAPAEEVESLADGELEVIAPTEAPKTPSLRVSMPPPVPLVALTKSSAPKPAKDASLNIEEALQPFYRGLSPSERAEPQVDDLSFRLDNPFARSSLVPPPKQAFPWMKIGAGAAAAVALTFGGYFFAMQQLKSSAAVAPAPVAAAVPPAATPAPAPAAVAPVVAVAPAAAPAVPAPATEPTKVEPGAPTAVASVTAPSAAKSTTGDSAAVAKKSEKPDTNAPAAKPSDDAEKRSAAPAASEAKSTTAKTEGSAPAAAAPEAEAAPEPVAEDLPETPTREQIMASFEKVRGEIETCAAGGHGIATTNVSISGAGRVTYAMVEGVFAGTPQGSCMARAVRTATFPRFSAATFKVSYPFSL